MLKKLLASCLLLLSSCSNDRNSSPSPVDGGDSGVFVIQDAGIVNNNPPTSNDVDSAVPKYYDPCLTSYQEPTEYSRLMKNVCVDSNNVSYIESYYDKQLQIKCVWKLSSDFNVRCLPFSEQTPQYADDSCTIKIALAATDLSGKLISKYIGLYTSINSLDAGVIDSGGYSRYIEIYSVGIKWTDDGSGMFYLSTANGSTQCNPESISFIGTGFFYLGPVINPTTFLQQ